MYNTYMYFIFKKLRYLKFIERYKTQSSIKTEYLTNGLRVIYTHTHTYIYKIRTHTHTHTYIYNMYIYIFYLYIYIV